MAETEDRRKRTDLRTQTVMNRQQTWLTGIVLTVALILVSCDRKTIYSHYEHTQLSGWEKNDTLIFNISPVDEGGIYHEEVGLRINDLYPFMSLNLVIDHLNLTQGTVKRDTLNCSLIERDGRVKGKGVSFYQYNFHLNDLDLRAGDSLSINIRHNMKREILPGIADVGIKLIKAGTY